MKSAFRIVLGVVCLSSHISFAEEAGKASKKAKTPEVKSESTSETAPFKSGVPATVGQYLEKEGLKTESYKVLDSANYFACSPYKPFGKAAPQSNLAYYIEGNATSITNVHLTLNINNLGDKKKGHADLLAASLALSKKATGKPLPSEVRKAIEAAKDGEWKTGDVTFKVTKTDFEGTIKGYALNFQIE